jgi:hypothetical protein
MVTRVASKDADHARLFFFIGTMNVRRTDVRMDEAMHNVISLQGTGGNTGYDLRQSGLKKSIQGAPVGAGASPRPYSFNF